MSYSDSSANLPRPAHECDYEANRVWAMRKAQSQLARWAVGYVDLRVAAGDPSAVWEEFSLTTSTSRTRDPAARP